VSRLADQAPRAPGQGALLPRLGRAWRALTPEGRLAAFASLGLFLTMFLPWYQQNAVVSRRAAPLVSADLSAFGVFSFIEAAVLLVALAVLALLFARAERRTFHLPGGDGTVVLGAGLWAALLLVWRLFDKPGITTRGVAANVGIQWGIFFALGAAGVLAYAGSRMRAGQRPEPPYVAVEPSPPHAPAPPGTTATRVLPPERQPAERAPSEPATAQRADDDHPRTAPRRARPVMPDDQLTIPLGGESPSSSENDER
jgi:hypothetical protein